MINIIDSLPRLTWKIRATLNCHYKNLARPITDNIMNIKIRSPISTNICSHRHHLPCNDSKHKSPVNINCQRRCYMCSPVTAARHKSVLQAACVQKQFHTGVHGFHEEKIVSRKRQPVHDEDIELLLQNSQETIREYADLLDCSVTVVEDMVRYDRRIVAPNRKEDMTGKISLLLNAGFTGRDIASRCQVFRHSLAYLSSRLASMQSVKRYRFRIANLLLPEDQFRSRMANYRKEVQVMGSHASQTSFVAELLECSQDEVVSLSKQVMGDFLLSFPPSRLQETAKLLLSFGVTKDKMREKVLMLRIQPDVIRERLKRMVDAGVFDVQRVCSALYYDDVHLDASFATWIRNAEALTGFASERDLLKTRLLCTDAQIDDLFRRKPRVAGLSSGKLKSCLDILQREIGVSSASILVYGDLLHFSPQRLRNRWAILRELGLSERALVKDLLLTEYQFSAKYGFDSK